jgi:hypothetical protein
VGDDGRLGDEGGFGKIRRIDLNYVTAAAAPAQTIVFTDTLVVVAGT